MQLLDPKFAGLWKRYVFQALLAGGGVFLSMLVLKIGGDEVVVASLAATAFVVFSLPSRAVASPRHVIGGHSFGMLVGVGFWYLRTHFPEIDASVFYAGSVTLAFFLMMMTNTDHPPAAGTAMGLTTIEHPTLLLLAAILAGASVFSLVRALLRKKLIDLR
ncbi:MAG: CBS domain-containing membrane protein [Verrucomicrobiales bacterium]|jgi:CBS domain-containing membrane protein